MDIITADEYDKLKDADKTLYKFDKKDGRYHQTAKSVPKLKIDNKKPVTEPANYGTVQKKEAAQAVQQEKAKGGIQEPLKEKEAAKEDWMTNADEVARLDPNSADYVAKNSVLQQYYVDHPEVRSRIDNSPIYNKLISSETRAKATAAKAPDTKAAAKQNDKQAATTPAAAAPDNKNVTPTTPTPDTKPGADLNADTASKTLTDEATKASDEMKNNTATNSEDIDKQAKDALAEYDKLVKQGLDADELPRSIVDAYKRGDFGTVGSDDAKHTMIYYIGDTIANALNNFGNTALKIAGKGGGENKEDAYGTYLGKAAEAAVNRRTAAKDQRNKMIQENVSKALGSDTDAIKEINDFERSKLKAAADDKLAAPEYTLKLAAANSIGDLVSSMDDKQSKNIGIALSLMTGDNTYRAGRALALANGMMDTDIVKMWGKAAAEDSQNTDLKKMAVQNAYSQLTLDKNFANSLTYMTEAQKNTIATIVQNSLVSGDLANLNEQLQEKLAKFGVPIDIIKGTVGAATGLATTFLKP